MFFVQLASTANLQSKNQKKLITTVPNHFQKNIFSKDIDFCLKSCYNCSSIEQYVIITIHFLEIFI